MSRLSLSGFDPKALKKYVENAGWLFIARIGSLFLKMLVNAWALPNYLGNNDYGRLNYPLVLISFFTGVSALGLDAFVTRQLLQHPEQKNVLLGTSFRIRLWAGIGVIPLIYLTYIIISGIATVPPAAPVSYVLIISLTCVFQSVNIIDSFFQSRAEGKFIMQVQVGANLVSSVIKFILIFMHASLIWFVCSLLLDAVLLAIGYVLVYRVRRNSIKQWVYNKQTALFLITHAWPLAFSGILVSLYMKIDQLMLDAYYGKSILGVYSNVVQLSEGWYFIPVVIVTALFPAIMNARKDDHGRYLKRLQNLYDLMVVLSTGIAVLMTLFARPLYHYLYKPEYAEGAYILAIHIWSGVFVFLGTASSQYLIAERYTNLSLVRTAVGALVNILLNIYWIPRFGMAGAAYATLISYFISTFFIIFIPATRQQGIFMLKSMLFINIILKLIKR